VLSQTSELCVFIPLIVNTLYNFLVPYDKAGILLRLYSTCNPNFTFRIMFHDAGVYWSIKYCFSKLNTTSNQVIIWALLIAHCWKN